MKTTNLLNNSIAYIRLLVVKTKRWSQEIQIKLLLHQDYLRKIEQNESSKNLPYNYEVIYLEKLKPEWYWLIKAVSFAKSKKLCVEEIKMLSHIAGQTGHCLTENQYTAIGATSYSSLLKAFLFGDFLYHCSVLMQLFPHGVVHGTQF